MEYDKNGQILREFYARHDLTDCFERDNTYLESAFDEIIESGSTTSTK